MPCLHQYGSCLLHLHCKSHLSSNMMVQGVMHELYTTNATSYMSPYAILRLLKCLASIPLHPAVLETQA